jgi:NADPH:quinone reductase-like Zn-dependent oxidoreductase
MMRAIIADPSQPHGMRLANVPPPIPKPGQVLVEVRHYSLNLMEIQLAENSGIPAMLVLGWDAAGVVVSSARNPGESGRTSGEFGPAVGDRVVTHGRSGGWAQRRSVTVDNLAIVPESVDLAAAAALPVSATTALGALRDAGPILGRRVLVTGASGGVGRFAVQLAALGGAYVIASVGSRSRGRGLRELGANEVVLGIEGIEEPVDVILDLVGGPTLVEAFGLLTPGGTLESIGGVSGQPAVFPPYATVGPRRSLVSFALPASLSADLATLTGLLADGRLAVDIGWHGSWERHNDAVAALLDRKVNGKAVLDVTS